jgi:hypothetical protein
MKPIDKLAKFACVSFLSLHCSIFAESIEALAAAGRSRTLSVRLAAAG